MLVYWSDGMTDGYACLAFYDDGIACDEDDAGETIGWWSYRNSVGQEKVEPTHWMPFEPPKDLTDV